MAAFNYKHELNNGFIGGVSVCVNILSNYGDAAALAKLATSISAATDIAHTRDGYTNKHREDLIAARELVRKARLY